MKTWIGYILSLYLLFCAVVPCSVYDGCEEATAVEQTHPGEEGDCTDCSPFSICAPVPGLADAYPATGLELFTLPPSPGYRPYRSFSKSEYHARPFQPPRLS